MADFAKINGVAAADIAKIDGVTKSSISAFVGCTTPSEGATRWVMVHDDRNVSHIPVAEISASSGGWSTYDAFAGGSSPNPSGGNDHIHVAYGKDGNGDALWVATYATDACEIAYHDDPTTGPWTGVSQDSAGNNFPARRFAVLWGNDVWISVGKMGTQAIMRSVDGSSWAQIDVSGVDDINTTAIYALASDGAGNWWFAQENRIYESTDDGSTWSLKHTLVDSSNADPGNIRALVYTNSTLVAGVDASDATVYSAAASDLTDWSTETTLNNSAQAFDQQTHVAAAAGRVVVVGQQKKWTFDVSGKTITMDENGADFSTTTHGTLSSVSTDGTTWVATCYTGDTFVSTDGGDSWAEIASNVGSKDALDAAPDVYLPL